MVEVNPGSQPLYLSGVDCNGLESSLLDCELISRSRTEGLGFVDPVQCGRRAGVMCESE